MEKEIGRFFYDETNSRLKIIPHKNKDKIEILNLVIDHFESNVFYSESEVNRMLKGVYDDFPLLRRYLVDFNFLCRDMNGYAYWKNNYYEVLDIPKKDEIYRFVINNFKENTRIPVEFGVVNEILKFDLHFYLSSKLIIIDKTEIRLNKSMFKLSDFNFYTPITEKQFIVKNTMTENTVRINSEISVLNNIADIDDVIFLHMLNLGFIVLKNDDEYNEYIKNSLSWFSDNKIASIMIAPTTRCNFLCSYCYENGTKKSEDMNIDELSYHFSQIRKFIEDTHVQRINFTLYGGEPSLTSKRFMEKMISEINSIQIETSTDIISNGYMLSSGLEELMTKLKVSSYQITLDGPKRVHDNIRKLRGGGETFDKIVYNIQRVLNNELCDEVIIRINCSRLNINSIPELLTDLAIQLESQIKHVFISFGLLSYGLSHESNTEVNVTELKNEDLKKYCRLYKLAEDIGFNVASKYCDSNLCLNKELGCLIIGPNYEYYKCMKAFGYKELSCDFGDILKSNLNLEELKKCEEKKCAFLPYCFLGCLMDDYTMHATMNSACKYDRLKKINEGIVYELYK